MRGRSLGYLKARVQKKRGARYMIASRKALIRDHGMADLQIARAAYEHKHGRPYVPEIIIGYGVHFFGDPVGEPVTFPLEWMEVE